MTKMYTCYNQRGEERLTDPLRSFYTIHAGKEPGTHEWHVAEGAAKVRLQNAPAGYEFFIFQQHNQNTGMPEWIVSEASTGCAMARYSMRKDAIGYAEHRTKLAVQGGYFEQAVAHAGGWNEFSPRYLAQQEIAKAKNLHARRMHVIAAKAHLAALRNA